MRTERALWLFAIHLPLSVLPAGLHKFLTNWEYAKRCLDHIVVRPFRLYFNRREREQWLRDMVDEGRSKNILTDEDAHTILSQLHEPYIQRYLVSLVVHLFTLPVTQIVSVIVAWLYFRNTGDELGAGGILVLFQVIPISPGSIARGLYAVGIMTYDRSFKDYNVAVFLSFFKYIGYLAFPIQMTYRYPTLARFMATHWATEAVHAVPVFGEPGALLEHTVFCWFYNWPLTIRGRMGRRAALRAQRRPRYWHVGWSALVAASLLAVFDYRHFSALGVLPTLRDVAGIAAPLAVVCGAVVTLGCGGASLQKRIVAAALCGVTLGILYTVLSVLVGEGSLTVPEIAAAGTWRIFIFSIAASIGAIITELGLPEPQEQTQRLVKE